MDDELPISEQKGVTRHGLIDRFLPAHLAFELAHEISAISVPAVVQNVVIAEQA